MTAGSVEELTAIPSSWRERGILVLEGPCHFKSLGNHQQSLPVAQIGQRSITRYGSDPGRYPHTTRWTQQGYNYSYDRGTFTWAVCHRVRCRYDTAI